MRRFWLIICIIGLALSAATGQAIRTVNTADDNFDTVCDAAHCSLRDALFVAWMNAGRDSIIFNIPGAGPHRILVDPANGALPALLDSNTVIDGTSQPGNNPMAGQIIIDGSQFTGIGDHGLVVYRSHTRIYGLQIEGFPGSGLQVFGGFGDAAQLVDIHIGAADKGNVIFNNGGYGIEGDFDSNCTVKGNIIGTDLNFSPGLGNGLDGLGLNLRSGTDVVIGGLGAERNYFCSNGYSGMRLSIVLGQTDWTGDLRVVNNYIGTDPTGTQPLGNLGEVAGGNFLGGGINIGGEGPMRIGGAGDSANVIAFNYNGIYHNSFDRKTFNRNQWYCNTNAAIRLDNAANNDITTPNSICVGDGLVNGLADPNVTIEIFDIDTSVCPGGVPCQGNELIGTTTADANGFWTWNGPITPGSTVSVLAIDDNGNVSEFSTCADYVTVEVSNSGPYCQGDSISLFADISGNVENATFEWLAPGGLLVAQTQNATILSPREGPYELFVVFDDCEFPVRTTEVVINDHAVVEITDFCLGESWTVNGTVYNENNTEGMEVVEGVHAFGCDSIYRFDLELNPSILGSMSTDRQVVCLGDSVEVRVEASPGTFGPYDVVYNDGTGANDTLVGIFNGHTFMQEVTENLYFEVLDINTPFTICDPIIGESDSVIVSNIQIDPEVSDFNGFNISCKGANDGEIILGVTGGVGENVFDWDPSFLFGDTVSGLRATEYAVTVTDEGGCTATFDTVLTEPIGPDPVVEIFDPTCLGAADGQIWLDTVFDVIGQLMVSADSVNFAPVGQYPFIIDTLTAGAKTIYFMDDGPGDCVTQVRVVVPNGITPFVDAGSTLSMAAGDSVQLGFETDIAAPFIDWFPADFLSCATCPEPSASPPSTQFVSVFLENEEGCAGLDSVLIQVFIPKRAYIPNVFSPNGDDINDFFTISTNEFGEMIESIVVLNRGGVVVFSGEELPLNSTMGAWNGSFNGRTLNPGVFTYLIEIRYSDGEVVPFSGTVTLVR